MLTVHQGARGTPRRWSLPHLSKHTPHKHSWSPLGAMALLSLFCSLISPHLPFQQQEGTGLLAKPAPLFFPRVRANGSAGSFYCCSETLRMCCFFLFFPPSPPLLLSLHFSSLLSHLLSFLSPLSSFYPTLPPSYFSLQLSPLFISSSSLPLFSHSLWHLPFLSHLSCTLSNLEHVRRGINVEIMINIE